MQIRIEFRDGRDDVTLSASTPLPGPNCEFATVTACSYRLSVIENCCAAVLAIDRITVMGENSHDREPQSPLVVQRPLWVFLLFLE
ncbi:hypothetical protein Zmor_023349 [Zophobas morio]|uniref:Uncharacterized protein n=1 Tax=Zophobas morio TaxID=2755281 RepID=A0AA38M6B0_9CUCU|nr:hypothetical protein Zmor_023349 [Zophobas morio]